ncbi:hypothetical protein B0T25DRAFT_564959 [Lasiosphaeria hispida]|uniref:Ankyrin n=1 Tax=Lasiosphaeria hispida TaxID=260671 RepID=A0AAJ0MI66_9PEZI|nr:hypothetical protein B0T25DRAFT_564959 [Lasiosphaeria hispida]
MDAQPCNKRSSTEHGNLKLIDILLAADANVNAPAAPHRGVHRTTASKGFLSIAHKLLSLGANVDAERAYYSGRTALEGAAEHGRIEMLHLLLHNGARMGRSENWPEGYAAGWQEFKAAALLLD